MIPRLDRRVSASRYSENDVDIPVTGDAMHDLRMCVAHLRNELTKTLRHDADKPIDAAQVLNETGDVALAYQCYNPEHERSNPKLSGGA